MGWGEGARAHAPEVHDDAGPPHERVLRGVSATHTHTHTHNSTHGRASGHWPAWYAAMEPPTICRICSTVKTCGKGKNQPTAVAA